MNHQATFEYFSDGVFHERGELSQALQQIRAHLGQTHLSADIQWQVNGYLALHHVIEHDASVQRAEHYLCNNGNSIHMIGISV